MTFSERRRANRFDRWLRYGIKYDLCPNQFCMTHDAQPMTNEEEMAWDDGIDLCCHVVRLGAPRDWRA